MRAAATIVMVILVVLAVRRYVWAYVSFVLLSLAWIPARTGFALHAVQCRYRVDFAQAIEGFRNFPHIVLFSLFFVLTWLQMPRYSRRTRFVVSFAAVMIVGLLVELQQGATGTGNCRMRDLIPDALGGLLGFSFTILFDRVRSSRALKHPDRP